MKLETFFEKFGRFTEAPNAVAKMRELVLELAVRGKLVGPPALPETHPAWLAFQIETRKRIYSYDTDPRLPFKIPERWEWCALNEVADCGDSAKVSPTSIDDADWVLDLEDIDGSTGRIIQYATFAERRSLSTKAAFKPGDVLYGKLRPYLNKVVVAAKPGFCTTEIVSLRPSAFLSPYFLRFYLRSLTFLRYTAQKSYGMKMPRLGTKDLEAAKVPVPPPAEQKRIVSKVDELMALCDRLEMQQKEQETRHAVLVRASLTRFTEAPTPSNLNFLFHKSYDIAPADLRKTILTLAVQGKLVSQDPKDKPAIADLKEIAAERAALIESRKLRPNRVSEIPQAQLLKYEIPDSWRWFRLGDVAFFQEGPGIRNWQFRSQGTKLLNVQNIVDDRLVLENTNRYVSTEEFEQTYQHFAVETGDILFASSGASWGKAAWFEDPGYAVMLNTSMVRLKFYSKRCADTFLFLFLRTEFFKAQMERQLVGIQPNFGSTHLGRVYIPIPPLAEQRRIVAKVDQLMVLVNHLEGHLAASRATAANLLDALVAELTALNTCPAPRPSRPCGGFAGETRE